MAEEYVDKTKMPGGSQSAPIPPTEKTAQFKSTTGTPAPASTPAPAATPAPTPPAPLKPALTPTPVPKPALTPTPSATPAPTPPAPPKPALTPTPPVPVSKPIPTAPPKTLDTDKTVKLTPDMDKAGKMSLETDKTMKLSSSPSAPAQEKPIVPPPLPPPPPPPPQTQKKSKKPMIMSISVVLIIILLGVSWYFLPPFLKSRAEKLSKEGKFSDAIKYFNWALNLYPLKKETYLLPLGKTLANSKDYSKAQVVLEQVLQKDPNNLDALNELAFTFIYLKEEQKAFDTFQKYLQVDPANFQAKLMSGELAFKLKKYSECAAILGKLAESSDLGGTSLKILGEAYWNLGKLEESANALQKSWEKIKLPGVNALLAKIYISEERYAEGASLYKLELTLSPQDTALAESFAEICLQAGKAFLKEKNLKDAQKLLEDGISVPSKSATAIHYQLAVVFAKGKKKKDALTHLKEAVSSDITLKKQALKETAFSGYRKLPEFSKIVR